MDINIQDFPTKKESETGDQMKISTKGRYALRTMLDIAQNGNGGLVPLRDISARQEISPKYLEQIVSHLAKAGFLRSGRGAQGGYSLARRPEEYSVGDILRVTEGSLAPIACLDAAAENCPRAADCQTLPFWQGLDRTIQEYVDRFTLADLLEQTPKA
jgi:Rrf2 family protein